MGRIQENRNNNKNLATETASKKQRLEKADKKQTNKQTNKQTKPVAETQEKTVCQKHGVETAVNTQHEDTHDRA